MSSTTSPNQKKSWIDAIMAYFDHRALFLLFLGFAAGLPYFLIFSTLSLWLKEAGVDRGVITFFAWAGLGYSFKFVWAGLIDAIPLPIINRWLGRRRAWMFFAQLSMLAAVLLIASTNPVSDSAVTMMAVGAVLLGFSAATQDIVIDAFKIEVAPISLQPILASTYVLGYRIGMIVSGAGALMLATYFGTTEGNYVYEAWQKTYLAMAGMMGVGFLTTLTIYEPRSETLQPKKQAFNQKLMAIYASLALIPGALYGLWYLSDKVMAGIFESNVFAIPEVISSFSLKYGMGITVFMPIALVFLLINQPKFTAPKIEKVVENNSDYVRLVSVFFLSVFGLVFTFRSLSRLLPEKFDSTLVAFLANSGVMLSSITVAGIVGYVLVRLGLVKKEVALKTWINPVLDFFDRYGKQAILLLLLIGLYRISDIVAGAISNLFYADMGFTKDDIAKAVKLAGAIMLMVGSFLGGLLTQKMNIMKAMMVGAILASTTNLLFILLTMHQGSMPYMYFAVIVDNLAGGMAMTIFLAFLSALTSIRFTAVQYAIFSSIMTLFPKLLAGYSGTIVNSIGYASFFWFTFAIGMPILILIWLIEKKVDIGEVPNH